ncbi:MAG TPA: hypothetical protein P5230_03685 [Candidatus Magasanikbacteria bacterium]|nr:hypothetical protein [Candidatus Magasanikbacteria bacterium]
MFDDEKFNNGIPPQNLPVEEPKDMFGDFDDTIKNEAPNALEAGMLKKKENFDYQQTTPTVLVNDEKKYVVKEPILGKIILIVLIGVLLAGIAIGGFWIYDNFLSAKSQIIIVDETQKEKNDNSETKAEIKTPLSSETQTTTDDAVVDMKVDEVLFGEPIDSDKDGLDDVREKELGTGQNKPDSDSDGLIDGDEVIIWKTNPLNPDTDGDGFNDGTEVKNGYNPLGIGKIFSTTEENVSTTPNNEKSQ